MSAPSTSGSSGTKPLKQCRIQRPESGNAAQDSRLTTSEEPPAKRVKSTSRTDLRETGHPIKMSAESSELLKSFGIRFAVLDTLQTELQEARAEVASLRDQLEEKSCREEELLEEVTEKNRRIIQLEGGITGLYRLVDDERARAESESV